MNPLNLTDTANLTYCTCSEAKITNYALHEWLQWKGWEAQLSKQNTTIYYFCSSLILPLFSFRKPNVF